MLNDNDFHCDFDSCQIILSARIDASRLLLYFLQFGTRFSALVWK